MVKTLLVLALVILTAFFSSLPAHGESVTATIQVDDHPYGITINPATNTIYVSNVLSNDVSVIDGTTNTVTKTIQVDDNPHGITVNPATNTIYVVNNLSKSVSLIDGTTNTVTKTIPVGSGPLGIAVNPTTNKIYVSNENSNDVSVIDGTTNTVTKTIPVGSGPLGIAVNPTTNTIYVVNTGYLANGVSVIDGTTNTVTKTIPVGSGPLGIAVNPATNTIYVVNTADISKSISVIDGTTNTVTKTVPDGQGPRDITVDPATNTIYVANYEGKSISIIDGTTNTVTKTIPVDMLPYSITANPATNMIYVANYFSKSVSVIDGTTNAAPGHIGTSPSSSNGIGMQPNTNTVIGKDSTPPVVIAPPGQVFTTTSSYGSVVYYPAPTATDNVGISSAPSCNPPSGSNFLVGVTAVTCTATDIAGNVGRASFTVTVQLQSTTAENPAQNISNQKTQSAPAQASFPGLTSNISTAAVSGKYSDPQVGIQITFPDGWRGQSIVAGNVTAITINMNSTDFFSPTITFQIVDKSSIQKMVGFFMNLAKNPLVVQKAQSADKECDLTNATITVNGMGGEEMTMQCSGLPLKTEYVMFASNRNIVSIMYQARPTDFEKYSADFNNTLSTLHISNAVNPFNLMDLLPQNTSPGNTTPTMQSPSNMVLTTQTTQPPQPSSSPLPSLTSPQTSSIQTTPSTLPLHIQSPVIPSGTGVIISTDKSSYFLGDTITALVVFYGASAGQNIAVSVTDPIGNTIISKTVMTDSTGASSLQFKLPASAKTGSYQVEAKVSFNDNDFGNSAGFYVQESTHVNDQDNGSKAIYNGETIKSDIGKAQPLPSGNGFLDSVTNFFSGLFHW